MLQTSKMKQTIIKFEECFNMFTLLEEWLVLMYKFELKKKRVYFLIQKVFKLILLYQLQVKTDFFLQQSLSRY